MRPRDCGGEPSGERMSGGGIRTIAVHLPTAGLCARLLDAAIPLAEAHGATLVGVHVLPAVVVYADATVSMSTEFIVAQQEAFQEDARAVEAAFRSARRSRRRRLRMELHPIPATSRRCGRPPPPATPPTWWSPRNTTTASPPPSGYSPDELVLGTGRPVLDRADRRRGRAARQTRARRLERLARGRARRLRLPAAAAAGRRAAAPCRRQPARQRHDQRHRPARCPVTACRRCRSRSRTAKAAPRPRRF